jgi:hypothetical protein
MKLDINTKGIKMSKYLNYMNSKDGVRQIFTREKIAKMSTDKFEKYEKRIHDRIFLILRSEILFSLLRKTGRSLYLFLSRYG